ncbi:MAG: hypothetical protein HY748_01330 [Elusimicrobia bacterium]|nr:hypothetical protein [Elusimicrobiota bacterium]
MRGLHPLTMFILILALAGSGIGAAQEGAADPEASARPEASVGEQGETAAKPEPQPKPKAKAGKKRTKTKKETAEERYKRSKYYSIMPSDTKSYKFSSEKKSSGAASKKKGKKKGKAEPAGAKKCGAGICALEDGCECCGSRLDCEELAGCQWQPDASKDDPGSMTVGKCVGQAGESRPEGGGD